MMKTIAKIRYIGTPFFNKCNHFAIGFICLVLFVILPIATCYADEGFLSSYSEDAYLEYCNAEKFNNKYSGDKCWSCDVIAILMDTMINAVQAISPAAISLAQLILIYGSALWLGIFFLKSLSSAAAQDPAQILTAVFTFMFKVALVYIFVIDGGFADLINWIVNPLLSIGIDIGKEFSYW